MGQDPARCLGGMPATPRQLAEYTNTMTTSRRKFIKTAAQGGISAAALSAFPPSIRKALAIPAHHETGTIKDVKHVVVLMQENRAFDHYFGTLNGVRGFGDRLTIPQPGGRKVWEQLDRSTSASTACSSPSLTQAISVVEASSA